MFKDERSDGEDQIVLVARIINTGEKMVIIDRDSFVFYGNGQPVKWHQAGDFFGRNDLPSPLLPGDRAEVGMYEEAFRECVGAEWNERLALGLEMNDTSGRRYRLSGSYTLLLEVGEVSTSF